eukprot:CCRYP_007390-RA/>CCRYP_007390-RA protein AED:0.36 eAED:0.32 QI:0/-1/0/1/-1/0/1/0/106
MVTALKRHVGDISHFKTAALQGYVDVGRCNGAIEEHVYGHCGHHLRHILIAAKQASRNGTCSSVKSMYMHCFATKSQYINALKGYQGAVNEMKSSERDLVLFITHG